MNFQPQFNLLSFPLQFLNGFGQGDLAEAQTLTPTESLNTHKKSIKLVDEIVVVPQQLDDLSAVIQKCNVKGFEKAVFAMDRPSLSISAAGPHRSRLPSHSQDLRGLDKKARVQSITKRRITNGEGEEEQEESLKRKRSVTCRLPPSSSLRETDILSERDKRSQMNELFAQMHSLLPNPTGKRDKASIVTDTIKYIHSLHHGLAIHSRKHAATILPNETDRITLPLKSKPMSSVSKASQTLCTKCDKSMCSKHWEENLIVNYNGNDIFVTINCVNKEHLLPLIILAVESRDIQVMDAFVSNTERVTFLCLHVKAAQILDTVAREALSGTLSKLINSEFRISFKP